MLYFKYLFLHMEDLTPNEGLVYSELLFHSMTSNKDFMAGEMLYMDEVKNEMANYKLMEWEESIPYYPIEVRELMNRMEMSFPTVKKILENLKRKKYIDDKYIKCPLVLLQEGYLKIPKHTGVRGRQLIFYGFLLNRAGGHYGTVDTWAYRFKELCGIDADDVYFMIKQLKKKGLVERLDNMKLKIHKPSNLK